MGQLNQKAEKSIVLDVEHYWFLLKKNIVKIFTFAIVITSLVFIFTLNITPTYQATASLLIKSEDVNTVAIDEVVGVDYKRLSYYETQYQVLQSREIAKLVVDKLNLTTHSQFDLRQRKKSFSIAEFLELKKAANANEKIYSEEQLHAYATAKVKSGTSITPVRNTQIVKVSFQSQDKVITAKIANAIAEVYIENHLATKLEVTQKASSWLKDRLQTLEQQLLNSEINLQQFKEDQNLIDLAGVKSIKANEIEQLSQKLVSIRQQKAQLKNTYEQIEKLKNKPTEEIIAAASLIEQTLTQKLKEQEVDAALKLAELSKRYGKKHPRLIAAKSEYNNAQKRLAQQVINAIDAQKKEYKILSDFEKSLMQQQAQSTKEYQNIERKTFKLETLKREVESNTKLYNLFLTRAKETVEAAGFSVPHARVLESALPSSSPIKPRKKLITGISFIASLIIAIGLILLYDFLDNTIKTSEDIEEKLNTSTLGLIPFIEQLNAQEKSAFTGFIDDKHSTFAESIRTLRTSILLSSIDAQQKVFIITSSIPNEGKSTVAINLSVALGQMKKTLLIDADMRRPTMAKTLSHQKTKPGLSELIVGTAEIDDCIIKDTHDIDILLSGITPPNPLELISSEKYDQLLAKLSQRYEYIVIDSPPMHSVSDAMVLSMKASGVVYVVKADATHGKAAAEGIAKLDQQGAHVLGAVLNQINSNSKAYSSYYGYYSNYSYTSEDNNV